MPAAPSALNLAVIGGDGIGPEVTDQALAVLRAVCQQMQVQVHTTDYDLGARRYHATGEVLPEATLEELRGYDAILLGAVGDPSVPPGVLERGLLLKLRFAFDHAVNLRPARLFPGVATPLAGVGSDAVDFVVIREGTEGAYVGAGGVMRQGSDAEIAVEESLNTALGVRRAARYAFELAASRPRHTLTLVHKTNVLVHAGGLWQRIVNELAAQYPQVSVNYCHIDAATIYMVTDPGRFDVIVTDNLFGDILTDLAAAVAGGIGLAASGNLNIDGSAPSMFEPVHGSAPDIAGQGVADPVAAILSAALLLRHVGLAAGADAVETAVAAELVARAQEGAAIRTAEVGARLATAAAEAVAI